MAKQGTMAAQIELANAYRKGIGVTQDCETAVQWFALAAEQGDAVSQYNLSESCTVLDWVSSPIINPASEDGILWQQNQGTCP